MREELAKYYRQPSFPHIWCPGCGNGIVMGALVRAIDQLKLNQDKTVIVSGIGCSSRAPGYLNFNTLHTAHGRALAFATGVKLAKPELTVIVITGDGDATAIGGNHFIHAARRNIDITTVIFNNSIYGMTGGQYSPLTPMYSYATTAPFGHIERPFDIPELARAAGATYVARATAYHAQLLTEVIANGIQHKGFAVIDAITQCPISFGRRNKMGKAAEMLKWQRDHAVPVKAAEKLSPAQLAGKFLIGELHRGEAPEYTEEYQRLVETVRQRGVTG